MPIQACSSEGKTGFKWGSGGHCYPNRAGAERQAAAAYANGYAGDEDVDTAVRATRPPPAAGLMIRAAPTGRYLFLHRGEGGDHPGTWCFPGGRRDPGKSDGAGVAAREAQEEAGFTVGRIKSDSVPVHETPNFETYHATVPDEFEPALNDEHDDWQWAGLHEAPEPLHPGVEQTIADLSDLNAESDREHPTLDSIAMDRDTVRHYDDDGRMHVSATNISKANVCPYLGNEIPDWQGLGLDPDKIYMLLRDPEELKKATKTFNNLPLLSEHVPVSAKGADTHKPDLVVGSTGTDAVFEDGYLKNSLVIWAKSAVDGIESNRKKELSSAYYYKADMTPGVFNGERYDGVMREIVGNHVSIVTDGRAGKDVVVGDSADIIRRVKIRQRSSAEDGFGQGAENEMAQVMLTRKATLVQGALFAHLTPLLAADASLDLTPILKGVGPKNYKARKPAIVAGIKKATAGKLAADASLDDVVELLDKMDDLENGEEVKALDEEDAMTTAGVGDPEGEVDMTEDEDPVEKVMAFLTGKVSSDELNQVKAMLSPPAAADEAEVSEEEKEKDKKDMITQGAMDSAIKAAVTRERENSKAIREAEAFVRPWVGEIVAQDSASAVYGAALKALGVDIAGVHPSAYSAILKVQPKPGDTRVSRSAPAMDAAGIKGFAERYPGAQSIKIQ